MVLFEYVQLIVKYPLGMLEDFFPKYITLILLGLAFLLAYLYSRMDFRNIFSKYNKGLVILMGFLLFILFEAILQ